MASVWHLSSLGKERLSGARRIAANVAKLLGANAQDFKGTSKVSL
jgi:hypothetical protein